MGVPKEEARETVRAKLVGRWSDGVPLLAAPTYQELKAFRKKYADVVAWWEGEVDGKTLDPERKDAYIKALVDFKYRDDPRGIACPFGAHLRRVNTRDMLDPRGSSTEPKDLERLHAQQPPPHPPPRPAVRQLIQTTATTRASMASS